MVYTGLFLLPVLLVGREYLAPSRATTSNARQHPARTAILITLIASIALVWGPIALRENAAGHLYSVVMPPPLDGNLLLRTGMGPVHLHDFQIDPSHLPALPNGVWWTVTLLGIAGALLLIGTLVIRATGIVARRACAEKLADSE